MNAYFDSSSLAVAARRLGSVIAALSKEPVQAAAFSAVGATHHGNRRQLKQLSWRVQGFGLELGRGLHAPQLSHHVQLALHPVGAVAAPFAEAS